VDDTRYWCGGKTRYFYSKTHFQSIFYLKHLGNTLWILLNQSIISKNIKNSKKPKFNLKPKNLPKSKYIFRCFQGTKHLIVTSLIIWNHLTQKITVLVVVIVTNDNFISQCRNPATPSLFFNKKLKLKNNENEIQY
jgi:hypothetical protein